MNGGSAATIDISITLIYVRKAVQHMGMPCILDVLDKNIENVRCLRIGVPDSWSLEFVIDIRLVAPLILLVQSLFGSIRSHDDTQLMRPFQ